MKCLKCSEDALPDKALCAKCYAAHEQRESYHKTDEWLNQVLDATRDLFKTKGSVTSSSDFKPWLERLLLFGALGAILIYLLVYSLEGGHDGKGAAQNAASDSEAGAPPAIPVPAATPTVDTVSRTVWVGNSPGSLPLLVQAIDLVERQERHPERRWTIKLEPGEHRVAGTVVVPSFSTITGAGHLESIIIGTANGLNFSDRAAALVVLQSGSRIEQASIENEGTGDTTIGLSCFAAASLNSAPPGDDFSIVHDVWIRARKPSERKYGIVNNGCTMRLEQVDVSIGQAGTTGQALLSVGDTAQTLISNSSFLAEDENGECSAQTTAGCVGASILRGTVSVADSKISGASQGATILDGTLQLVRSQATGPRRGITIIQSGTLLSEGSKVSSIANASSGQVVCRETTKSDGSLYSADCS